MPIYFDSEKKLFQLDAGDSSYVMMVRKGYLTHLYWGARLEKADHSYMARALNRPSFHANLEDGDYMFSLDTVPMEYGCWGRGDLRVPSLEVINADGSNIVDLQYDSYCIHQGKLGIEGLPATYCDTADEAQTLEIVLKDAVSGVEAHLYYGVFEKMNVISRWAVIVNGQNSEVSLQRALSANIDFDHARFNLLSNYGAWGRERMVEEVPLFNGRQEIASRRGASSHTHNPFMILKDKAADENHGEAFGLSLVYSGSFTAMVDVDSYRCARASIGINPDGFAWKLGPGESFATPEVNLVYSGKGVGALSRTYHSLYRDHLCRGKYRNKRRPVLLNTWEGCYFDFNEEKVEAIAVESAKLGVELVVVDDGWFGKRDNDTTSLGDWFPDLNKLPGGLQSLAKKVNDAGCDLGIWFEPEMINPVSELYKAHPEWVLHVQGRPVSLARQQMVIDMSRTDVQDYLFDCIAKVIEEGNITYIKWDYNRNFAEVGSAALPAQQQSEIPHRFILGLYSLLERLVTAYPDVLFESCSGGGGRFDPGMLHYMPQTWTSDNSDAIKRLKIQYGTSLVYPMSSMTAHLSASPNHQTGMTCPVRTRKNVALTGSFGFELNPILLSDEEKQEVVEAAKNYKLLGELLVNGDYYRLTSPFESNNTAWMYLAQDKTEIFVVVANSEGDVNDHAQRIQLAGLAEGGVYVDQATGARYTAAQLINYGLQIDQFIGNKDSRTWHLVMEKA